ncbi:MAG: undecaprenyldiphospho-muramoylpentapeptide beta-N-acetylglucosaminyltransferase [Ruminococcaceae bacterium]|nr:undecaprenyldiphospho-muramoylpentapeptide beta-N-acetylglucosaminyltransferase [Oscillospiraceae bacterium]
MKVLLSGGGTAGHINPALAAAGHLSREHGAEILFVGTKKGLESKLIPDAGYDIRYIEVSGLIRRLTLKNLLVIKQFVTAVLHAKKIIKAWQPDVVIGTGGYVCAPVLFAAHALHVPTVIHEQNVIPGVTVKMAASIVDAICISFPETTKYLKPALHDKCVLTGNPIREELLLAQKEAARASLGLDARPFVVAFGGSLGAQALNNAIVDLVNTGAADDYQLLFGTGQRYFETVSEQIRKNDTAIRLLPYIKQMDVVMAAADVVIGRSGALTVSELCALGKPAILIPSPNVAHDHQTYNAKSMEDAGAALLIRECDLNAQRLKQALSTILGSPETATQMSEKAKAIGITDGAGRISQVAVSLIK